MHGLLHYCICFCGSYFAFNIRHGIILLCAGMGRAVSAHAGTAVPSKPTQRKRSDLSDVLIDVCVNAERERGEEFSNTVVVLSHILCRII